MAGGNFHEKRKLEKMAGIHQRFCKTSNEVTKREILTNSGYKKMANFGRKREISAKMANMPKRSENTSFLVPIRSQNGGDRLELVW